MFRWLVSSSLQLRYLVAAAAVVLVAAGTAQLRKAPVDVFPEFAPPVVEVQTEAVGLSAVEVESLITLNLEELLSGVPWLDAIRSRSVTGLSSIVMIFKPGTDLMRARQLIQERLTLAYTLPNVAQPPVILQPLSATSRFMMVGLNSRTIDPTELSLLARWTVKPRLAGVPGVANVAIWGQRLRQMQVQFDPERIRDARILQEDLIAGAGDALWVSPLTFLKASSPGTGGFFDNRNQRIGVEHRMPIRAPDDLARVPMSPPHLVMAGRGMALGEVADVTYAHAPLIGDAISGVGEGGAADGGLLLVIEKFPGANTLETTRGVEQALAELGRGLPGVQIDTHVFRLAGYVEDALENVTGALAAGAVLMVLVIGFALRGWRLALAGGIAVVLSLLAALMVLRLMDATVNTMILAGLVVALGAVIDDAIVGLAHLAAPRTGLDGTPATGLTRARLVEATLSSRAPMLYATTILVIAVLPVFVLHGVSGDFFGPLAQAYVLAVLASLVVAFTVTPALTLMLFEGREPPPVAAPLQALADRLAAAGARLVQAPRAAIGGLALVLAAGVAAWAVQGESLLPPLREQHVLVDFATPPGTSHTETHRIATRLARELRRAPGVRHVGGHIGRAITGDQVVGINAGQLWVALDRTTDAPRARDAIRDIVDGYPGIERTVQTYLRDKVPEVLTGAGHPVVVRVYGKQREVLQRKAEDVAVALAGIDGLTDLRADNPAEEPQVQVKVDLDAAGRAGVKPGDVRRTAATVFSGLSVGYLFEEQRIYDVVVWGTPEARSSVSSINDLWVEKADRRHVRLGDVAKVSIVSAPTQIRHERIAPYVDVVANVSGRDVGRVTRDVQARLEKMEFPLEYHAELLGEHAERSASQRRVLLAGLAAVAAIVLVLQAAFGSWRLAAVATVALPAALAGGVLASLVTGSTLSLGSLVGLLAVLGIGARHALALVHGLQRRGLDGAAFDAAQAREALREALPAVLTSAVAVLVALLPVALLGRAAGLEIIQPMAVVMIGGVIASTAVAALVLPALVAALPATARRREDLALQGT